MDKGRERNNNKAGEKKKRGPSIYSSLLLYRTGAAPRATICHFTIAESSEICRFRQAISALCGYFSKQCLRCPDFWTINYWAWLRQQCPTPKDKPSEIWWTRYAMWLCPKCFALLFLQLVQHGRTFYSPLVGSLTLNTVLYFCLRTWGFHDWPSMRNLKFEV